MKVYTFEYCGCIFESSYAVVSLHQTKATAWKAMNKYINENFQRDYDDRIRYGKYKSIHSVWKFGEHERWCITEMEILP